MNLGHQVETAELSDADLDGVAGGLSVVGTGGLLVEAPAVEVCGAVTVTGSVDGLALDGNLHVGLS